MDVKEAVASIVSQVLDGKKIVTVRRFDHLEIKTPNAGIFVVTGEVTTTRSLE